MFWVLGMGAPTDTEENTMAIAICNPTKCDSKITGCTGQEITYTGAVLATGEHNWYDDSEFFAIVWDATTGTLAKKWYGGTNSWTYHNHARRDATADVLAAAAALYRPLLRARMIEQTKRDNELAFKGDTVRSTTTRGKNKDVVGVVKWIGESRYGKRVGIKVDGEEKLRYLDADKVARVDAEPVDVAEIDDYVAAWTGENADWVSIYNQLHDAAAIPAAA